MDERFDVVVVGAGLAGLTAAVTVAAAGQRVVAVDAHGPGGRARVTERDGFTFNMGAHAFYKGGPAWQVLERLGVRPVGSPPPLHRYKASYAGETFVLPVGPGPLLRTRLLGVRAKAQLARVLSGMSRLDPARLAGTSIRTWIDSYDLQPGASRVLEAVTRLTTYSGDFDAPGADGAVQQIQYSLAGGVLYLDGGWARLVDQMGGLVEVRGGQRVTSISAAGNGVEITTSAGRLTAKRAVVAVGTPGAARALLADDPGWGDVGPEVTAACLDIGARRPPDPGYVLGIDEPLYVTTQSPPASRQAPEGQAVVGVVRYGCRNPEADRADCDRFTGYAGVSPDDIVTERFLARMVVAGSATPAALGGLAGRPSSRSTGTPGVFLAGDWVGPVGLLADAAVASGHAAGLLACGSATVPIR